MSFRREKYIECGGPDGGNGGRGGDVIITADNRMNTLIDFRYQQHYKAQSGKNGEGRNKTGAAGEHCHMRVPVGTQILDADKDEVLMDFTKEGQSSIFLRGGDAGFGNARYKSSTNQAPRKSTPGWPGQEATVWLRLKLIADVGLVGLPNAGKSTFLAACSNAKPKIADYPFTTLAPNLGVVKAGDNDFVIADIPGLIRGASQGQGLGDRFLGHIERTSVLLHLIDCTNNDVLESYNTIKHELKEYGYGLENKEELIILTKIDALGTELADSVRAELEEAVGRPVYMMSSVSGELVDSIMYKTGMTVREHKEMLLNADKEDEPFSP